MSRERWGLSLLALAVVLHTSYLDLLWMRPGAWTLSALGLAVLATVPGSRRAAAWGAACLVALAIPLIASAVLGHLDPNVSIQLDGIEVGPWPGRVFWMTGLFAVPVASLATLAVHRGTPTMAGVFAAGLFAVSVTALLSAFSTSILWGMSAQIPAIVAGVLGHGLVVYELADAALAGRIAEDVDAGTAVGDA